MSKYLKNIIFEFIRNWPDFLYGVHLRKYFYNKELNTSFYYIGKGCVIDRIEATQIGSNVILGENVKLIISAMAKCYIGDNVGIADGVYIRSANHNFSDINIDILAQGHTWRKVFFNNNDYGIVIERNVWIGARAILLSGSHIGEGSVISAGSVVSSIVPPYSIVVGNPGRIVGNRKAKTNLI